MIIIVTLSVHIEKALPDDLGRAFFSLFSCFYECYLSMYLSSEKGTLEAVKQHMRERGIETR